MRVRVHLVDDHPLVVDGLLAALSNEPDLDVVAVSSTLAAARAALPLSVDVVVSDVRLPDGTGFELLKDALTLNPRPAFLMISSFGATQYLEAAMRLGAAGFLLKTAPTNRIIAAIRSVHSGGTAYDVGLADARRVRLPTLTSRERQVVAGVVEGRSNDEIAASLGISRKTVEAHLSRLYARTGIVGRTELAVTADRDRWLDVI